MASTGRLSVLHTRTRSARLAALALGALLLGACGGDDGQPAQDKGTQDAGVADGSVSDDAAKPDGPAKTEGGVATGDLANLSVYWTIDGTSDNPAALCAKYNVGYFSLVVRVDAPTGSEVLSQGFLCQAGGWTTGEALNNLPYGPYLVRLTAAVGACCSGGTTIAEGSRKLWLKKGTSTDVAFNLANGQFDPAP